MIFQDTEANRNLAQRIFLENLDECLIFPKYFEIETVNACNARCIMCTVDKWTKKKESVMADSLFEKFAEEVASYNEWIETICLNRDGEPTLDKSIAAKVKTLKSVGIKKVTLTTNAQLLTSDLSRKLIQNGLDDIMISIDGITKETFEIIRKGLCFEKVVNNTLDLIKIRNELNSKMTIRIRLVIMKENKHEVEAWIEYWSSKINVQDRVYAMPAHNWGNQIVLKEDKQRNNKIMEPCVFLFSSIAMHVNGSISLCNADYDIKHLMGDFTSQSIKEIWIGEHYRNARELHASGRRNEIDLCIGCDLWNREYMESK